MLRSVTAILLCAAFASIFAVALPTAALAQGAGDDQYADPFGDMPVDNETDTRGDEGSGSAPSDTSETAPDTSGTTVVAEDTSSETEVAATPAEELPSTGLPAGLLALTGLALLAGGTLIHFALLRFAPNSGYARALRMGPLHQAPRPPGFEPLVSGRRVRRSRRRT